MRRPVQRSSTSARRRRAERDLAGRQGRTPTPGGGDTLATGGAVVFGGVLLWLSTLAPRGLSSVWEASFN